MHDPFRVLAHAERAGDLALVAALRARLDGRPDGVQAPPAAQVTVERLIRLLGL